MTPMAEDKCLMLKDNYAFFKYLNKEETAVVTEYLQCQTISAGEVLWSEGEPSDLAAFVVEGRIEIKKQTEFPNKNVIVGLYGQGAVVGEPSLFRDSPRSETAAAVQDTSLLVLTRDQFDRLIEQHPYHGAKLLKGMTLALSTRLQKSFERLAAVF